MNYKEGEGWKLAKDFKKEHFPYLLGGNDWVLELREKEGLDLLQIITDVLEQYGLAVKSVMDEEKISLELERLSWWVCIEGYKDNWSLRLIYTSTNSLDRSFEVFWPSAVAGIITKEMRQMWESN